jgi:hypothetical protein
MKSLQNDKICQEKINLYLIHTSRRASTPIALHFGIKFKESCVTNTLVPWSIRH